jgi:hypothetical protein
MKQEELKGRIGKLIEKIEREEGNMKPQLQEATELLCDPSLPESFLSAITKIKSPDYRSDEADILAALESSNIISLSPIDPEGDMRRARNERKHRHQKEFREEDCLDLLQSAILFLARKTKPLSQNMDNNSKWISFGDFEFCHEPLALKRNKVWDCKKDPMLSPNELRRRKKALKTIACFIGNRSGEQRKFTGKSSFAKKLNIKNASVKVYLSSARSLLQESGSKWTVTPTNAKEIALTQDKD